MSRNPIVALQNGTSELRNSWTLKGHVSNKNEVDEDAQRPNIYRRPLIVVVTKKLWRRVRRTTTKCVQVLIVGNLRAESKVRQFHVLVRDHEDIFRFDVAVHVALIVLEWGNWKI